jgi:predicted aldo/keto reductase-like oxidoreductase
MKSKNYSRREFVKQTVSAGMAISGVGLIGKDLVLGSQNSYDAKGLPTAILGKTGMRIPRMAFGLGSRFCNITTIEESNTVLNYALDNGLYYWDTAWAYENTKLKITSEVRVGEVVKSRRKEIFLSTKVTSREPDEAKRQIEQSFKRLNTDHLDILKIHSVLSAQDVDKVSEKGNLIDILHRYKEQGITRFIGFSGHADANALKTLADRGDFDSMLMAMNHWERTKNPQSRQETVIPAAKSKGMGVMLMKVVRPRETVKELKPEDLVRYALSLKGPDGIIVGMDSLAIVKSNLEILRNFKPMNEAQMKLLANQLTPFFKHENLPWMKPDYYDGNWT